MGKNKIKLKPGDKCYLTPTQLRNARKRRAKQKQSQRSEDSIIIGAQGQTKPRNKRPRHGGASNDPSLHYVRSPLSAPVVQAARQFFKTKGVDFPISLGPTEGWRTVAKLAVRNVDDKLTVGLFAPRSHNLVEVPNCPAHHPAINEAVSVLQEQARMLGVAAFDETSGEGHLRHVAFAVQRHTSAVQLTLIWSEKNESKSKSMLKMLCKALVDAANSNKSSVQWHSIWVHYNSSWKHSNAIFSHTGKWEKLFDDANDDSCGITEYMSGFSLIIPLHFPPYVFRQANLTAFEKIIESIRIFLKKSTPSKPRCLELYGGVGVIGLNVADLCSSLVSSDENPYNDTCFKASAKILLEQLQEQVKEDVTNVPTIEYQPFSASKMVESGALDNSDLVIVDPPRKGLEDTVSTALARPGVPKTLVYVSCGFEAFQRDYEILTKGGWHLNRAEGHMLFPGSNAIESLAFFTR